MNKNQLLNDFELTEFELKIAQKMALDIRYFCDSAIPENEDCKTPVTKLHKQLFDLIKETSIGGIILFAENLENHKQIIKLTDKLQQAASESTIGQPLIISIDQEGGRVTRLPFATNLSGNMAIGATYKQHGTKFATLSAAVIGQELSVLGINNNYAPVVDVNTNPENPVINSRSFGENPEMVADLGAAMVEEFQRNSVIATLKHFPGHGDTHVDSHVGLPIVERSRESIETQDLAPFRKIIQKSSPAMIMTAHIQYPALDDSKIISNNDQEITRTATMSRKILTDLLRNDMKFEGIIATDALNMAGVASYFDPVTIVVETFSAGADVALMPFVIRKPYDITRFKYFIREVADKLKDSEVDLAEVEQSLARINKIKSKYVRLQAVLVRSEIRKSQRYYK
jgi:beta-N-acetylhexosaminidase